MWNVHRMAIKIEQRNLDIRKTGNDFSVQVRNFLLSLSLKVFRHKERDKHSFYSGFLFHHPPHHLVWHLPKASASKRKSTLLVRCPVLNSTDFFKIPKSSERFRCMTPSHLLAPFPIWAIVTSLSDMLAPRARAWTPVLMLHLSNPCTEPKGSQPN